jgi:hypothetical protein
MRAIRLAVPLLVLALATLAKPAEAIIYCDDFCCISSCSRQCWTYDGVYTTCGAYGSCYGSPDCTGFMTDASADLGQIVSPLVCTDTASNETAPPAPAETAD